MSSNNSSGNNSQIKRKLSDITNSNNNIPSKSIKLKSESIKREEINQIISIDIEDDKENNLPNSQLDTSSFTSLDNLLPSQNSYQITLNKEKFEVVKKEQEVTSTKYYQQHYSVSVFEENIQTVLDKEAFLFLEEELEWWKRYKNLNDNAKSLLCRIYIRKFQWLRENQLTQYFQNIQDLHNSIRDLYTNKLIVLANEDNNIGLEELLNQLILAEIKQIVKILKFKKISMKSTKSQFIEEILKSIQGQPNLFQMGFFKSASAPSKQTNSLESKIIKDCLKLTGQLVKLEEGAYNFFNLINRVFTRFGDVEGQHVMSTSMRTKIGLLNYMNYEVIRSDRVFPNRESLLEYEAAWNNYQTINELFHSSGTLNYDQLTNICNLCSSIKDTWKYLLNLDYSTYKSRYFLKFTPVMLYTKIMTLFAACLGKLKRYKEEEALLLDLLEQTKFRKNKRGVWWTRLCLLQATHLSKSDDEYFMKAYESCKLALEDKVNNGIDPGSANSIYHRMVKLESKLKLEDDKKCKIKDPRPPQAPIMTIYGSRVSTSTIGDGYKPLWRIIETSELVSVENFTLHTLTKDGWKGYHSENSILTTLFALLFLDILFDSKPGAFETKFQAFPLDLGSEAFYSDRREEIENRYKVIREGEFETLISKHYETNYSKKPSILGLNWEFELTDILELSRCIGGNSLSLVCEPFCKDYFSYSNGMPDLCIWNSETNQCKFIEVKGPGDKLSEKQKNWLDYLTQCSIPVQVCYVKDDIIILESNSD